MRAVCAAHGTACLVRDHVGLALEIGADGVHLGGGAADVPARRAALGRERILGVSCGRSRDAAMTAGEAGADYVGFGDLGQRPGHEVYELLQWWSELFVLPCLAEAAITEGDCAALARAGADFVAVGGSIWTDAAGRPPRSAGCATRWRGIVSRRRRFGFAARPGCARQAAQSRTAAAVAARR